MTLRDATPIPCSAFRLLCTDRDGTPLGDSVSKEKVLISMVMQLKIFLLHRFRVGTQIASV